MGAIFAAPVEEGAFDMFSPANISPLVAYLSTEKNPWTGQVFKVTGGSIQRLKGWSVTDTAETDGPWSIDLVRDSVEPWK